MKKLTLLLAMSCALATSAVASTPVPSTMPALTRGEALDGVGGVHFAFDSAELDASDRAQIDRLATWLAEHPGYRLVVEGHTDAHGSAVYNVGLASARARVVREALLERAGVDRDRVIAVVYGKDSQPLASPYASGNRLAAIYATQLSIEQVKDLGLVRGTAVIWE